MKEKPTEERLFSAFSDLGRLYVRVAYYPEQSSSDAEPENKQVLYKFDPSAKQGKQLTQILLGTKSLSDFDTHFPEESEGFKILSSEDTKWIESLPSEFNELPLEILDKIASWLPEKSLVQFAHASHSTFFKMAPTILKRFLQCVAYGQQDEAEELLKNSWVKDIPALLTMDGTFTDYSDRTFYCTAFQYALWARDTRMRCMIEKYLLTFMRDEKIRADIFDRIYAFEEEGLIYQKNGKAYRSAYFDFTPLKSALQAYVDGYDTWYATNNWEALKHAWMLVGEAQRDVPAHVAQEYYRPDRPFYPIPEFNEATLPRGLNFSTSIYPWFPLAQANSGGLGISFAAMRGEMKGAEESFGGPMSAPTRNLARADLEAITLLDEVRTNDPSLPLYFQIISSVASWST